MPLDPGTRPGPCEFVSLLGAGGMGEVYRARDTRLDRAVTPEMVPAHMLANPEMGPRPEREAHMVLNWRPPEGR